MGDINTQAADCSDGNAELGHRMASASAGDGAAQRGHCPAAILGKQPGLPGRRGAGGAGQGLEPGAALWQLGRPPGGRLARACPEAPAAPVTAARAFTSEDFTAHVLAAVLMLLCAAYENVVS